MQQLQRKHCAPPSGLSSWAFCSKGFLVQTASYAATSSSHCPGQLPLWCLALLESRSSTCGWNYSRAQKATSCSATWCLRLWSCCFWTSIKIARCRGRCPAVRHLACAITKRTKSLFHQCTLLGGARRSSGGHHHAGSPTSRRCFCFAVHGRSHSAGSKSSGLRLGMAKTDVGWGAAVPRRVFVNPVNRRVVNIMEEKEMFSKTYQTLNGNPLTHWRMTTCFWP